MSEKNEDQQTDAAVVRDEMVAEHPAPTPEGPGLSPRAGWRERVYGIKGVAAVAVAGLIVGGGAGAAIHAATADDGGRDGRPGFMRDGGRDGGGFGGPGGGQQGPGQGQGQLPQPPGGMPAQPPGMPQPPATPPDDSVSPDSSGDTTSGNNT